MGAIDAGKPALVWGSLAIALLGLGCGRAGFEVRDPLDAEITYDALPRVEAVGLLDGATDLSADGGQADGGQAIAPDGGAAQDSAAQDSVDAGLLDNFGDAGEAASPVNFVFVTSTTHVPADFGGRDAADAICADRAAAAGLPGTYLAYLGLSGQRATDRLSGARGWVRVDGLPVFDTVADVSVSELFYPLRVDETGVDIGTAGPAAATGVSGDGRTSYNCGDYTDPNDIVNTGIPSLTSPWAFGIVNAPCTTPLRLYCFGIDHATPVRPAPTPGRRAFVTTQPFVVGGGRDAADALCASEARLAGVAGNFLALIATSTEGALSRFDLDGEPWVRVDDVRLAETPLLLASGELDASLSVTATGVHTGSIGIWTGARGLSDPGTATCGDWTDPADPIATIRGGTEQTNLSFFYGAGGTPCSSTSTRLYCLEP